MAPKVIVDPAHENAVLKEQGFAVGDKIKFKNREGVISNIIHTEGKSPMVEYTYTSKEGEQKTTKNRPSLIDYAED